MFTEELFTIGKKWEHPKWPLMDEWDKPNILYTFNGYYAALRRKKLLIQATVWMNLEDIMVSEINQSQKDKYCMIPHIWSTYSSQIHRDRNYNGGCQGPEKGRNVLFYGCRVSVLQNKKHSGNGQ